ncbi:hypothetical protein D3C72_1139720 [compost metagenome]
MVFARAVDVGWDVDLAQVDLLAAHRERAGLGQLVLVVRVAQVPGVERARQVGRVAVPVQQVEGRRRLALEVVADHVVPHQVVRAQEAEGRGQVAARQQAALAQLHLAVLHHGLVHEDVQDAGVAEVEEGGQQRDRRGRLLAARREHGQRGAQDGAAHAEAQRVDLLASADLLHRVNRLDGGVLDVVVPGGLGQRLVGVAPAHHEHAVALLVRIADERVVGLQVEDVELVDARRHQQERPLVHLGGERLVFEQLEIVVLEHHGAFGGGHVAPHFEGALVGHADVALLHVVQQVLDALGDALALRVDGFLLRLGVEGERVAGRGRGHPLLDREAQARLGLVVGVDGLGHAHHGAAVEQVHRSREGRQRVAAPGLGGKALVALGPGTEAAAPQVGGVAQVLLLDGLELLGIDGELGQLGHGGCARELRHLWQLP